MEIYSDILAVWLSGLTTSVSKLGYRFGMDLSKYSRCALWWLGGWHAMDWPASGSPGLCCSAHLLIQICPARCSNSVRCLDRSFRYLN
jgi:hypothetical protein